MAIFDRKPLESVLAESEGEKYLKRALGPAQLILLGLGAITGAGVYTLMAEAAAEHAGPAVSISFLIDAIACGLSLLCYAELATTMPISGTAYTYAYATLGEIVAWVIGWDLLLEYTIAGATTASSWSSIWMSLVPGTTRIGQVDLATLVLLFLVAVVLTRGVRESAAVSGLGGLVKVGVILLFVVVGIPQIKFAHYHPFFPGPTADGSFGVPGIFRAAGMVYFAFLGFDVLSGAAEEVKRPQRDIPAAFAWTIAIVTTLYVGFALVLLGDIYYTDLAAKETLSRAYRAIFPTHQVIAWLLSLGTVLGLISTLVAFLYGFSRTCFAMARDGLIPNTFGRIQPRWRTPYISVRLGVFLVVVTTILLPLNDLAQLTSIGTLFTFSTVCLAVAVLRKTAPDLPRQFRVPLAPWLPIGGALLNFGLMWGLSGWTWLRFTLWFSFGLIAYIAYGRIHSKLRTLA